MTDAAHYLRVPGRLVELSAPHGPTALLTWAIALVRDAQRAGETAAWVTPSSSHFHPPDAARTGVDLGALAVVRAPRVGDVPRLAERLVRSGAFGIVVLDLTDAGPRVRVPPALVNRLASLARKHEATPVCLTHKSHDHSSLGPLVALRATIRRLETPDRHGRFVVEAQVQRDRTRGARPTLRMDCLPPEGMETLFHSDLSS